MIEEVHKVFHDNQIDQYIEDEIIEKNSQVNMIVRSGHAVVGFVKFLKGYYIILVTKKKKVGLIGRHAIYKVKDVKIVPLFTSASKEFREEEAKYLQIFKEMNFAKGFYFSYTYDLTHSL